MAAMSTSSTPISTITIPFRGWRVAWGAFVLAIFGWGLGFYGPPVYLHAVAEARGWSVALVSTAVTVHFLSGAVLVANLPRLYARFGLSGVTRTGVVALAIGLFGWASATVPWQLFVATLLTGCGWVTMAAAAINAILAPWFVRDRPKALSLAYNGASVGGILFSPLWVLAIETLGFQAAALAIGLVAIIVVVTLSLTLFARGPAEFGQFADGREAETTPSLASKAQEPPVLPGAHLWRDWRFRTLSAGMALGLFAQIGLLAHLFSLIVPALGTGWAGLLTGLATASAIAGRTMFGWLMPAGADRRVAAATSYGVQMAGIACLALSGALTPPLIVIGVLLFGFGIGNATSLPPLIAQAEFAKADVGRVVPMIVALAQAAYAFAPGLFGLLRHVAGADIGHQTLAVLALAGMVKLVAITAFLVGRRA